MELKPFDISVVQGRPVYILNYSEYYLKELCVKCPEILAYVRGAIDDVEARQGAQDFQGHRIVVKGYDEAGGIPEDAVLLILSSYIREPYHKFLQVEGVEEIFTTAYFFVDHEMEYDLYYRTLYSSSPLENIIIFRSAGPASHYLPAWDFSDNARALFEYLLSHGYNKKYKLVWLVHEPAKYRKAYAACKNVVFLSYFDALSEEKEKRDRYYHYLCLAKFIFFCQSGVFARNARKDQIRVQLWHGAGIKSQSPKVVETDRYEYMIVSSIEYVRLHKEYFGLKDEQLIITGQPKDDLLFHPIEDWKERLDIPPAPKYVLWLPTWRKTWFKTDTENKSETGLPVVYSADLLSVLNKFLSEREIVLLIKLHPSQDRSEVSCDAMSNICLIENEDLADAGLQIDSILGSTDALVSDYSSVAIGYTLLNRPIAFTVDDMDEYKQKRGFNWDNIHEWLPGELIVSFQDFLNFIKNVDKGIDECRDKRNRLNDIFHRYKDDKNSKRVADYFEI